MEDSKNKEEWRALSGIFSRRSRSVVTPADTISPSAEPSSSDGPSQRKRRKSKDKKSSRWYRLRHRMSRRGVVPVNSEHPHYVILSCIKEGLRRLALENPHIGAKQIIEEEDCVEVIKFSGSFEGKEFVFESYANSVFATIRRSIDILEDDFVKDVSPNNLPYLEFISNSKSGQDFFLSNNMKYMFKSNKPRDVKFFLSFLKDYLQHFVSYPHSLIVKYVGCYSIKIKGKSRKYFLAMQNIFFPADRIEDRFDVKGCTAGRYQKPRDPGSTIITILKDKNFLDEELDFGSEREWFLSQLRSDACFLALHKCMDYSLLIGRQLKHKSEKEPVTVSTLLDRIGKSITSPSRRDGISEPNLDLTACSSELVTVPSESSAYFNNNGSAIFSASSPRPDSISSPVEPPSNVTVSTSVIMPEVEKGIMFPRSLVEGVDNFQKEHRRLLPRTSNGLHILDGDEFRYFVGVVDFFTRFTLRIRLAQYWKMVKYCCHEHSTRPPDLYSSRFIKFLEDRVR